MTKDDLDKCHELNTLIVDLIKLAKSEHTLAIYGQDDDNNTMHATLSPCIGARVLDCAIKEAGRWVKSIGGTAKKFRANGPPGPETYSLREMSHLHTALLWQLGYNAGRSICIYDVPPLLDGPRPTARHVIMPTEIGTSVLRHALASAGDFLRNNGVDTTDEPERDCFECNGSGKVPIGDRCR